MNIEQLEQAVYAYARDNNFQFHGWLSRKIQGLVAIISEPGSNNKRILRVSSDSPNHKTYQFTQAWHNQNCEFLPQMSEPNIYEHNAKSFVVEQYEFIGTPPRDDVECVSGANDLFDLIYGKKINERQCLKYLYDALCGLAVLHKHKWYHLDFSLENVACGEDGRGVLIDFETSAHIPNDCVSQQAVMKLVKRHYRAPEMKEENAYVVPAGIDAWMFGVSLFAAVTRQYPFQIVRAKQEVDQQLLFEYVRPHGFMTFLRRWNPKAYSEIVKRNHLGDLLDRIFVVYDLSQEDGRYIYSRSFRGEQRWSAAEIRDHPFWKSYLQEERMTSASKPMSTSDDDCKMKETSESACCGKSGGGVAACHTPSSDENITPDMFDHFRVHRESLTEDDLPFGSL